MRRCARYLMESINFPLTKSRRVRKDGGKSGGKTAGKLGRVVVRNTQPMPLTLRPSGIFPSLRQVPNGEYQFSTHKIATRPQRCGTSRKKTAGKLGRVVIRNMQPMPLTSRPSGTCASLGSLPHLFRTSTIPWPFFAYRKDW